MDDFAAFLQTLPDVAGYLGQSSIMNRFGWSREKIGHLLVGHDDIPAQLVTFGRVCRHELEVGSTGNFNGDFETNKIKDAKRTFVLKDPGGALANSWKITYANLEECQASGDKNLPIKRYFLVEKKEIRFSTPVFIPRVRFLTFFPFKS